MKKNYSFLPLLLTFLLFAGCSKPVVFEGKVIFPNANWAFENKAITIKAPLTSSEKPYSIILELELIGVPNVDLMNAVFTMITPKGGKTMKAMVFNFISPHEPYEINKSNNRIYRLIVYPKKYFYETGEYIFEINQFSNKADNYGIHSLTLRIEKAKE